MQKKEVVLCLFFIVFMFFLIENVSSLGVSPAKREYNFKPGLEGEVTFTVFGDSAKELEMYVRGDLAQYVSLDKKTLIGGGGEFTAKFKLPDSIEKPGRHRIEIWVAEKIDEELIEGTIGTSVIVVPAIDIYVPYPGRYLDVNLMGQDVNVGEPVEFQLDIKSSGDEEVSVIPKIEIYSSDRRIETLLFNQRIIASQEFVGLKKTLSTVGYNPGNYKAKAIVDYGALAEDEVNFRIGDLVIDMTSYTSQLVIGKLQKFDVGIKSGWNNQIDGAYAQVDVINGSQVLDSFKTTSTSLVPWEERNITGYLDTSNYTEGFYDANITVFYFGKEVGKSTSKLVKIEFIKLRSLKVWYIIGGAGIFIILALILIKILLRNKSIKNGKTKNIQKNKTEKKK